MTNCQVCEGSGEETGRAVYNLDKIKADAWHDGYMTAAYAERKGKDD